MPTRPTPVQMKATPQDVMNTIRSKASAQYKSAVPVAGEDNVKEIGSVLMTYPLLQNEFLSALVNRIGRVILTSKLYENPWAMFKKGLLDYGETIEEIFVNMASPEDFNPGVAESEVFKRQIPDVRAAFHIMNYQKFYKTTVSNDQLRQAFLSWEGITDLIGKIVDALYTGANNDEFLTMKYLLAKRILAGGLYASDIPAVEAANMKEIVADVKAMSNSLTFNTNKYNENGVYTHTPKDEQYVILNSRFDAQMDVEVLASAFNMDKAEFMGKRVLVDSFGQLDNDRLAVLFPEFTPLTDEEIAALDSIPLILVDKNFFMIFDNYQNFTEQYNGQGLYWNYWYHTWKTFSVSPFANAVVFTPAITAVTSVTVNPAAAAVPKGSAILLNADVSTTGFAPESVMWKSSSEKTTVDQNGRVTVGTDETETTVTITATSTFDKTKSGESVLTIS